MEVYVCGGGALCLCVPVSQLGAWLVDADPVEAGSMTAGALTLSQLGMRTTSAAIHTLIIIVKGLAHKS